MAKSSRDQRARALMAGFAERTGLTGPQPQRRYLWTDAFAVCNFVGLARAGGDEQSLALARRLISCVHHTLGRHRADDPRSGWISGLPDAEGELHPTAGGLRIGKALPERAPDEPFDERLEWERDGQYFHYLTKWVHALDQMGRTTGEAGFVTWAEELLRVAHRAFALPPRPDAPRRLYWKCSVDLSRPLVTSMGQHDPLDGFITCLQLGAARPDSALREIAADFAAMFDPRALATADPLGLGGLLCDAYRVHRLSGPAPGPNEAFLLEALLDAAAAGLREYVTQPDLRLPAERRLGFRELGLAIGFAAVRRLHAEVADASTTLRASLERVEPYAVLRETIESFWLDPAHHDTDAWREHADINDVMLATSLAPDGFLLLPPRAPGL